MESAIGVLKGKVFNIFDTEYEGEKKKVFQVFQVDKKGRASLVNVSTKNGIDWKLGAEIQVDGRFYAYKTDRGDVRLGFSVL